MVVTLPVAVFVISLFLSQTTPPAASSPAVPSEPAAAAQAQPAAPAAAGPATGAQATTVTDARKKEAERKTVEAGRLLQTGDLKQAEALAREAVAADPENPQTRYSLGLCLEAEGKLDEAIAEYKKMGGFAPQPLLELALVRIYLRQGNLDEAEKQARIAVEKNKWVPQPHLSLGAVAMRKRDYKTAIEEFSAAIDCDPQDWNSRISLGDAYRAAGRFDEALTQYSQALALRPDHPQALLGRAQTWEQLGRPAEAINAYEAMLKADSESPESRYVQFHLAYLYLTVNDPALKNPKRAVELAEKSAEATGWQNRKVLDILAAAYDAAAMPHKARDTRKKAEQIK